MRKSVEKALVLLGLALPLLAGTSAAAGFPVCGGSLKVQSSQACNANLLRYQCGIEGQNGHVAILIDLVPLAAISGDYSLAESAPYRRLAVYQFAGRTDYRQRGALVFEVGNEGDFYFSVLVSEDHLGVISHRVLLRHVGLESAALAYVFLPCHDLLGRSGVEVLGWLPLFVDAIDREHTAIRIDGNQHSEIAGLPVPIEAGFHKGAHGIQHTATAHFGAQRGPTGERRFSQKKAAL